MSAILFQGRVIHRVVRDIQHYANATLGIVVISRVEHLVRLVQGNTWRVVTRRKE